MTKTKVYIGDFFNFIMGRKTSIKVLEEIAIFDIHLYGTVKNETGTHYFDYSILAPDSSTAIDLAKEIAKRQGRNVEGLVIEPTKPQFKGSVNVDFRYLQKVIRTPIE